MTRRWLRPAGRHLWPVPRGWDISRDPVTVALMDWRAVTAPAACSVEAEPTKKEPAQGGKKPGAGSKFLQMENVGGERHHYRRVQNLADLAYSDLTGLSRRRWLAIPLKLQRQLCLPACPVDHFKQHSAPEHLLLKSCSVIYPFGGLANAEPSLSALSLEVVIGRERAPDALVHHRQTFVRERLIVHSRSGKSRRWFAQRRLINLLTCKLVKGSRLPVRSARRFIATPKAAKSLREQPGVYRPVGEISQYLLFWGPATGILDIQTLNGGANDRRVLYTGLVFWISVFAAIACFAAADASDRNVRHRSLRQLISSPG